VARVGTKLPGDVPLTLPMGTTERTYRLGVPGDYDPQRPTPLIVDLHGSGSNALQASVYSDLPRRAGARGYIVVTPDAVDGKWQISPAGADADFLKALVDDVERRYCVDRDRVHLIGMSLGAWKAAATACHSGDRYASIALVAVEVYPGTCPPMPVVVFHGTADPVVAYGPGGGTVDHADTPNAGLPGTRSNVARWAAGNGCNPKPAVRDLGTDVVLRRFRSCEQGADVDFYTIVGGGHTWPGSAVIIGKPALTTSTIDATRLALDWFAAHPRHR
jgi:polyhydroxybutyrate depolymerase